MSVVLANMNAAQKAEFGSAVAMTFGSSSRVAPQAIGSRAGVLGGTSGSNVTDGSFNGATYRTQHQTPVSTTVHDIVLAYSNWRLTATTEVVGANNITVKAYIEYNGVSYPVFFNGAQTATISPGSTLYSDPCPVTLPSNATFYDRVYVTNAGVTNGTWPLGPNSNLTSALGVPDTNNASSGQTDVASGTGVTGGNSAALQFGPSGIYGTPSSLVPAVAIYGDSIAAGVGDTNSTGIYQGFIEKGLNNLVPWVRASRGSYQSSFVAANYSRIFQTMRGITSVIDEMGINDILASTSLATFQALKLTEWGLFSNRGIAVFSTTITPLQPTSTDGATTVGSQTVNTKNPVRTGYNDWVRAGAPIINGVAVTIGTSGALVAGQTGHPLTGYIEVADAVETARNSGIWKVSPNARQVTDGAMTSASNVLTSATASFTSADVGTVVYVPGAGASGAALVASITAVTNATTVTLINPASTTVTAATINIGGYTIDLLHPSPAAHALMAVPVTTAVTSGAIK